MYRLLSEEGLKYKNMNEQPFSITSSLYNAFMSYFSLIDDIKYGYEHIKSNAWMVHKNFDMNITCSKIFFENYFGLIKYLHIVRDGIDAIGSLMYHQGAAQDSSKITWKLIDWFKMPVSKSDVSIGPYPRDKDKWERGKSYNILKYGEYLACWYWHNRAIRENFVKSGATFSEVSYEAIFADEEAVNLKLSKFLDVDIKIGCNMNHLERRDIHNEPCGRISDLLALEKDKHVIMDILSLYEIFRKGLNSIVNASFVKIYTNRKENFCFLG